MTAVVLFLAGCMSDVAPPAEPVPVTGIADAAGNGAEEVSELVTLRREHRPGERYSVVTSFELTDTPVHPDIEYTTWAEAEMTLDEHGGALVARGSFTKSKLRHGDAINPLGEESNLAGVGVHLWLDPMNRVTHDELVGQSSHNESFSRVVVDSLRAVRVSYPEAPVRVGETWTPEAVRWDTRPAGWIVVNIQPTYTLERVERTAGRRVAHVRWSGVAQVEPFEVAGIALRARVPVDGLSIINLQDGYAATHDIRGRVELSLASSAGAVSDVARVRITQQVTRLPGR